MKICTICKVPKELIEFHPHHGKCKPCFNESCRVNYTRKKQNKQYMNNRKIVGRKWWKLNRKKVLIAGAKTRAKNRGILCTITEDDFIIPETCAYLGIPIFHCKGNVRTNSPSLDEIVKGKGYIPGNVEVISYKANAMKRDASIDELIYFAHKVLEKFESK